MKQYPNVARLSIGDIDAIANTLMEMIHGGKVPEQMMYSWHVTQSSLPIYLLETIKKLARMEETEK